MERSKQIVRVSLVGIGTNLVLVLFKMAVGLLAHSIAIVLDAVNNLSDALSAVITIVGTRLAEKKPDRKHPYGHGRIEYITGVLIAGLVLAAGLTSFKESVEKILHPAETDYSALTLVIVAVAVAVKLLLGRYVKARGVALKAQTLVASGSDALFDAVLSFTTLLAAAASLLWGWQLEGWLGAVISLIILRSGVEILRDTLSSIIGVRADAELTEAIRREVGAFPGVRGVYDLALHSYGPTRIIGSVHIELADHTTAREIHKLTRAISAKIAMDYDVVLTVGIYASGDSGPEIAALRQAVETEVSGRPEILQMHGFYAEWESRCAMFDLVVDFEADAEAVRKSVLEALGERFPDWSFDVVLDTDFSD